MHQEPAVSVALSLLVSRSSEHSRHLANAVEMNVAIFRAVWKQEKRRWNKLQRVWKIYFMSKLAITWDMTHETVWNTYFRFFVTILEDGSRWVFSAVEPLSSIANTHITRHNQTTYQTIKGTILIVRVNGKTLSN